MEMPTVLDAAHRVRTGQLSAVELTRSCLEAVEEDNGGLNAFVHVDPDGALSAAAAVDAEVRRGRGDELGPLAGVPFGVKDLEDCAGMPTTRGSRWFAGGRAKATDAIHVGRLRRAGAVPIGKTATPEFGAWAYTASPLLGVTRNPWDPSRTPGGSSGGSSAAVSAGMVPFATASDGGGSIRTPAAFTGLVGLRATYGRVPTLGDAHGAERGGGQPDHHRGRHGPAAGRDGRPRRAGPNLSAVPGRQLPRGARPRGPRRAQSGLVG